MRVVPCWFAACIAASTSLSDVSTAARGDEPVKPTAVGLRGQPGRSRRRPFGPRRGVQRRPAARRLSDARHGQGPLPGHHQEARGPGVHRPGGRPAPLVLSTSKPSDRSARPPRSTPTAPWPTGAWRCRTSTIPSAPRDSSRRPASGPASTQPSRVALSRGPRGVLQGGRQRQDPAGRAGSTGSRRSSRSFPATSTPAPGWRW